MRKIVINCKFGGFSLSNQAIELYGTLSGITLIKNSSKLYCREDKTLSGGGIDRNTYFNHRDLSRTDPILIAVVEQLGQNANEKFSDLRVVSIPEDVECEICEHDGSEWIAEKHRKWFSDNDDQ